MWFFWSCYCSNQLTFVFNLRASFPREPWKESLWHCNLPGKIMYIKAWVSEKAFSSIFTKVEFILRYCSWVQFLKADFSMCTTDSGIMTLMRLVAFLNIEPLTRLIFSGSIICWICLQFLKAEGPILFMLFEKEISQRDSHDWKAPVPIWSWTFSIGIVTKLLQSAKA